MKRPKTEITTGEYVTLVGAQTLSVARLVTTLRDSLAPDRRTSESVRSLVQQSRRLTTMRYILERVTVPEPYRESHTLWLRALRRASQAVRIAIETWTLDPSDTAAWRFAADMLIDVAGMIDQVTRMMASLNRLQDDGLDTVA